LTNFGDNFLNEGFVDRPVPVKARTKGRKKLTNKRYNPQLEFLVLLLLLGSPAAGPHKFRGPRGPIVAVPGIPRGRAGSLSSSGAPCSWTCREPLARHGRDENHH